MESEKMKDDRFPADPWKKMQHNRNVTALVRPWILCCNDLWTRSFASLQGGADEFLPVELALLNSMILKKIGLSTEGVSAENFFERLRVLYLAPVDEELRQYCVVQRSNNVFCTPRRISILLGKEFRVKSIDTMGTMQNGLPYVEIVFADGYLLESPDSITFVLAVV